MLSAITDNIELAAREYHAAGLCVLPAIRAEKRPAVGRWKQYQKRLPTPAELSAWMANSPDALCILCGIASNNAEIIDFDGGGELFSAWWDRIPADLRDRLVVEGTPSGGYHVIYRCVVAICGNLKLAQRKIDDKIVTLIETRGEGGLFLCAPTAGYEITQGDMCNLPVLTEAERDVLLQAAWDLNEYMPPVVDGTTHSGNVSQRTAMSVGPCDSLPEMGARPGDDFNRRGDVRAVLRNAGWVRLTDRQGADGNEYWRRPGKDSREGGWSATLKECSDGPVFFVFSSNAAPFEPQTGYAPFAVYTLLEHDGDFEQASKTLRHLGYGTDTRRESADISAMVATDHKADDHGYRLVRADQIEVRPPQWLIHGLLEQQTLAQVYGDSGSGKSFLAIDMACRIATGTPWRDHAVKAGPVVYIAGEGQQGFGRRLQAWQTHHKVSLAGMPLFLGSSIGLTDPEQLVKLIGGIAREQIAPQMIVLDTLARNFGPGDENSTQDMTRFIAACDHLRNKWACCVLVVHHTGLADKSRSRGNSALRAALDAEYRVQQPTPGEITLEATKLKEADAGDSVRWSMVQVELPDLVDEYGNPVTSAAMDVRDADIEAMNAEARATTQLGKWANVVMERVRAMTMGGTCDVEDVRKRCQDEDGMVHRVSWTRALAELKTRRMIAISDGKVKVINP